MKRKHNWVWTMIFIGPHMVLFILFFLIPVVFGICISLTKWDLFNKPQFIGLKNYETILFNTSSIYHTQFIEGMKATLIFVLGTVPLLIVIPLLLAYLLNLKPKFNKVFQSILYLPNLFAISAVMIIWSFLLSQSYGPLKSKFNISIDILNSQPWAWIALILVTTWWIMGGNMIIYQAALNGVSKEVLEAADIDGANGWQKFFKIILPDIKFQLLFTLVTSTIAQFNVYGQPLMLTGGGPNNSTRVLLMYIQNNTFGQGTSIAGMSSAMAILLGLVIMLVSVVQFIMIRKSN